MLAAAGFSTGMQSSTDTYHLECPDPSNPDLEFALYSFDVLKLDALPPASTSWLPPKEQQLLRHANCTVVGYIAPDISSQFG